MYKLGTTPLSKQPTKTELADFLEVKCLLSPENVYSINSAKVIVMSSDEELIARSRIRRRYYIDKTGRSSF